MKTVGIIGFGSFGTFVYQIVQKYYPDISLKVYTQNKDTDDQTFFPLEEVCQSDILVLSVPIRVFGSVLQEVIPLISPSTILVDVCTVKIHPAKLLAKYTSQCQYICTHPMFGPYSYEKKGQRLQDLRIVLTEHNLTSELFGDIKQLLQQMGLKILQMTADEHDQKLSETLFITHLLAQTMKQGDFCRTDIDTVSFGFLMDAVESVSADVQLFQDVYSYNPYCQQSLERFQISAKKITDTLSRE